MRLLLDEHYPAKIASKLRSLGHDVICATERIDLTGLPDAKLVDAAVGERRAVVTENVQHFQPLAAQRMAEGAEHFGFVFTAYSSLPRIRDNIGVFVDRLSRLLEANPTDDAFTNRIHWL